MNVKDLQKLLEAAASHGVNELTLETGDYKLSVQRGAALTAPQPPVSVPAQAAVSTPAPPPAEPEVAAAPPAPSTAHLTEVVAPIVGTFYAASSPDAPAFVKLGDKVEAGTVLCIIEAMKLMNEIEAEVSGEIKDILVSNEDPVEYGQVLFRIDPA